MKRIDVTIGFREEYEDGEIRYYPGDGFEGRCYKDAEAFYRGEGVAYIREAIFEPYWGERNRDYVTDVDLRDAEDIYTRAEMYDWVKDYFKELDPKDYKDDIFADIAELVFNMIDWVGFDMQLDECDWDDDLLQREKSRYSVWVGGGEVNNHLLTKTEAAEILAEFIEDGYDDAKVVPMD